MTCSNILEDKLLTGLSNGPQEEEIQTEKKRKHKSLSLHFFFVTFLCLASHFYV